MPSIWSGGMVRRTTCSTWSKRRAVSSIRVPGCGVDALALEGEGGVARDDEAVSDARQFSGEIVSDAVGEVVLTRVAGEVGEGQHHDGQVRGFGWRGRDDGRSSVSRQEIP